MCCEPITEPKKEAVNTQLNKLPMISKLAMCYTAYLLKGGTFIVVAIC